MVTLTAVDWLQQFAAELGVSEPSSEDNDALLALAGIAAHASERTAAPLSCWLAARAGLRPSEAREIAERLAKRLEGE
jgi:Domain of unknown function (DUF6457)